MALKQHPFQGNDRETNKRATSIARQQIFNKQQLNSNRGMVFSMQFMLRGYEKDKVYSLVES
jgi:hypothetical protein